MNLTPIQTYLISAMTDEAQTARQLSERLGFDLQPVVESMSKLTKLGLVSREEVANPEYGRPGAKPKCYGYRHAADAAEQEPQPETKPAQELQPEKGLFLAVDISNANIHKLESDAHAAAEAMIADGATDVAVVRIIRTGTVAVVWS